MKSEICNLKSRVSARLLPSIVAFGIGDRIAEKQIKPPALIPCTILLPWVDPAGGAITTSRFNIDFPLLKRFTGFYHATLQPNNGKAPTANGTIASARMIWT